MSLLFLLLGCNPKNDPPASTVKPDSTKETQQCIQECIKKRQMEARAIEDIERDCAQSCDPAQPPSPLEAPKLKSPQ